jgi:imidazolonepropionase-like amidohydrolase
VLAVLAPFFVIGAWNLQSKENLLKTKALDRELARRQSVLIQNARIVTGTGEVIETGGVLIREGKIEQIYVGKAPEAKKLNAFEVEAAGKTVIPGLIDAHVHLGAPGGFYDDPKKYQDLKLTEKRLKAYLFSGITTVKSTGDWVDAILALREKQARGEILASELYAVGPLFTAAGGHPAQMLQYLPANMKSMGEAQFVRIPKDEAEARQMVRDLKVSTESRRCSRVARRSIR